MTNKTTKSALFTSSISLLLCFAMLLGTTFAWFTDSATSAGNKIVAGKLDVQLLMKTSQDGDYNDISNSTASILGGASSLIAQDNNADTLWEPGKTQVAYLAIKNAGNLDLKYNVSLIVNNVSKDLYEVMEYAIIPDAQYGDVTGWTSGNSVSVGSQLVADDTELGQGAIHYFALAIHMDEEAGNEYQEGQVDFDITVNATQLNSEKDSFGSDYDINAENATVVSDADELQNAIESAADGDVIALGDDIKGNLDLVQKPNTKFVIDGNGKTIEGGITLDGKSATYTTAGVVIQNVNFKGDMSAIEGDACIRLGDGTNATRYTCNVTVKNCTFDVEDAVGIKSYTGGDKNLTISNCTATARTHSLAQLKGVDGVLVENCTVNSVRGINFNNSNNVTISNSVIDVDKYAVRFGESANSTVENYAITNCTLSSDNVDGDATIVLRAGATNANLTLTNTTVNGSLPMSGHENANIVIQ